jgi:hypothetical protein
VVPVFRFHFVFGLKGTTMFRILGPGVYRRRNGEVIEIDRYREGVSVGGPIWIKKGSDYCGDRTQMAWLDSFVECGRVDAFQAGPFDLFECVKLVCTPSFDHVHGCPASEADTTAPQGTVEIAGERIGKKLSFQIEVFGGNTMPIEEAVQFAIQTCGISAVVQALALDTCPKAAFQKLFAEAMAQTVKRRICSNADVVVTFL